MDKYLYCIMDSTTSTELPGWDVEVFKDNERVRNAWRHSEVGTDDVIMREEFNESISIMGLESLEKAKEYVTRLNKNHELIDITTLPQGQFRAFYDSETMKIEKEYKGQNLEIKVFEEGCDYSSREEMNFNLIAIEFSNSPFNTQERQAQFKDKVGEGDGQHYGYVVDITNNEIEESNLLITGLGWGETATVSKNTEEYGFIESILQQVGALVK